ncbi:MAG: imelysin family protein [Planctomycetota bacterium]
MSRSRLPMAATIAILIFATTCRSVAQEPTHTRRVVAAHVEHCRRAYAECADRAGKLVASVEALIAEPSRATLDGARAAWTAARASYGRTEALRFRGDPLDEVEPLLNAWPIDETFVDNRAVDRPGIIQDSATYRSLSIELLEHANERGGEANISVGWHAVEFLLWGRDDNPNGPGSRSPESFRIGADPDAERRSQYLRITATALRDHLVRLAREWEPDRSNVRRRYETDPKDALRRMLTGTLILTAFELSGERLAVAYETKDQEQEHSCFSDTTTADLIANQLGIQEVLGVRDGKAGADSVIGLLESIDPQSAKFLLQSCRRTEECLRAIPHPFDQAFLGDDDTPGRIAIRDALAALDDQTDALAIAGKLFGFDLPMRPGN